MRGTEKEGLKQLDSLVQQHLNEGEIGNEALSPSSTTHNSVEDNNPGLHTCSGSNTFIA
jgi:hypothetical protein